jgi:hypothetical protein
VEFSIGAKPTKKITTIMITWPDISFGPVNLWSMPKLMDSETLYEKILFENMEKGFQYRLTVNEFREVQYLHIRKYFLSYEGEFVPTKEGAAIPASIQNTFALLDGLVEICSKQESLDSILAHFEQKIADLREQSQ